MSNVVKIQCITGTLIIDFENQNIKIDRNDVGRTAGYPDVAFEFKDITGIEVGKPGLILAGHLLFVLNNKRWVSKNAAGLPIEITHLTFKKDDYSTIENMTMKLSKELDIRVLGKNEYNVQKEQYQGQYMTERQKEIDSLEVRCRCNVCGKIYCFNQADINKNLMYAKQAKMSSVATIANSLVGSSYHAYEQNKMADSSMSKIVDYTRCPSCNSTNVSLLNDEEMDENVQNSQMQAVSNVSSADELKKFKELLDSGVITQEEFDAKKKQLLGL